MSMIYRCIFVALTIILVVIACDSNSSSSEEEYETIHSTYESFEELNRLTPCNNRLNGENVYVSINKLNYICSYDDCQNKWAWIVASNKSEQEQRKDEKISSSQSSPHTYRSSSSSS